MEVQSVPVWQVITVVTMLAWLRFARFTKLTLRLRSLVQAPVTSQVHKGTQTLLQIQSIRNRLLDTLFAVASSVVSVEFYTAFLPLLFWSGHGWLARQMTFLMALCIYIGNCVKDIVSAPRPASPPVRRLTAIKCEEESAMEFGLPSSHTINTICLSMYLFTYFTKVFSQPGSCLWWTVLGFVCVTIFLVAFGRMYLGMHTPVDILAGIPIGVCLLLFWCTVDDYVDQFVMEGENVLPFWTSMSFLLLFAYPKAEHKTPSFDFHTAFNGVVLGVVWGSYRFYSVSALSTWADVPRLMLRLIVGFPLVLATKEVCKEFAIRFLPVMCKVFSIPVRSSSYVPQLLHQDENDNKKRSNSEIQKSLWLKLLPSVDGDSLEIDTGIRLFQYAALGWSVTELVPVAFQQLGL